MPKAQKTVTIRELVERVNRLNRESTCKPDMRHGWNHLLEDVLHDANAYKGYGYYPAQDLPPGQKPGITGEAPNFQFPDESRRFYYQP